MELSIDRIRTDGGTQMRVEIDDATIADYAEKLSEGIKFPEIDVFYDGSEYWLAHGHHRLRAYIRANKDCIPAKVHQGDKDDAQWFSFACNKDQDSVGLRRTNADKERAVRAALGHPKAAKLSGHKIAEHVGVDEKTVRNWRDRLSTELPQIDQRSVTRNGKTYEMDVSNIGHQDRSGSMSEARESVAVIKTKEPSPRSAYTTTLSTAKLVRVRKAANEINRMMKKPWLQVSQIDLKKMVSELMDAVNEISL